ncbi:MAG: hypothetical protein AVDCRST_MAG44-222, partial [uncultured Sphingomonas sp.]
CVKFYSCPRRLSPSSQLPPPRATAQATSASKAASYSRRTWTSKASSSSRIPKLRTFWKTMSPKSSSIVALIWTLSPASTSVRSGLKA